MKTYLVGGAVRDKLLGVTPKERDWVVVGSSPQEMKDKGFKQVGKDFPVFIDPKTGEEYALARTERKSGHGYTGFKFNTDKHVSLEEDLERRDLTINAIAEDSNGKIIDPFNGRQDIINKKLRHVSDAFSEDPLRVLRVARFKCNLDKFIIDDSTKLKINEIINSGELEYLTGERIWLELYKSKDPFCFAGTLDDFGILHILPSCSINKSCDDVNKFSKLQIISIFMAQTINDIGLFSRQLKVPNEYKELAELLKRHTYEFKEFNPSNYRPKDLLSLIQKIDIRKSERLSNFLEIMEYFNSKVIFISGLINKLKEFKLDASDRDKSSQHIKEIIEKAHIEIVKLELENVK